MAGGDPAGREPPAPVSDRGRLSALRPLSAGRASPGVQPTHENVLARERTILTSRVRGVTRPSGWARGRRVPAYTRVAPLLKASSTSACPMPRLAPVTRTVIFAMFMGEFSGTRATRRDVDRLVEVLSSIRRSRRSVPVVAATRRQRSATYPREPGRSWRRSSAQPRARSQQASVASRPGCPWSS
jgi:hypothetical protein